MNHWIHHPATTQKLFESNPTMTWSQCSSVRLRRRQQHGMSNHMFVNPSTISAQRRNPSIFSWMVFCQISLNNKIFGLHAICSISFSDPPKIVTKFDGNLFLAEGLEKAISCSAVGSPLITVSWNDSGIVIPGNELRYNSELHHDKHFTEMEFTCVAENEFGSDFRTIPIKIIGENCLLLWREGTITDSTLAFLISRTGIHWQC